MINNTLRALTRGYTNRLVFASCRVHAALTRSRQCWTSIWTPTCFLASRWTSSCSLSAGCPHWHHFHCWVSRLGEKSVLSCGSPFLYFFFFNQELKYNKKIHRKKREGKLIQRYICVLLEAGRKQRESILNKTLKDYIIYYSNTTLDCWFLGLA